MEDRPDNHLGAIDRKVNVEASRTARQSANLELCLPPVSLCDDFVRGVAQDAYDDHPFEDGGPPVVDADVLEAAVAAQTVQAVVDAQTACNAFRLAEESHIDHQVLIEQVEGDQEERDANQDDQVAVSVFNHGLLPDLVDQPKATSVKHPRIGKEHDQLDEPKESKALHCLSQRHPSF